MKIFIDINHPAHVHYFKNFIRLMKAEGHTFCITNRDSAMINRLLDIYGIEHFTRNKRPAGKGTIHSLWNLFRMFLFCLRKAVKFHPDVFVGFASSACALSSKVLRKPCILLDDTEHNAMNHKIYMPCCTKVLTPFYFNKKLDKPGAKHPKQEFFKACVEQLYLHSKYYTPKTEVLDELGVKPREYVLVRYIAYDAHHDLVAKPIAEENKKQIIRKLADHCKVLVSLESDVGDEFYAPYKLRISPEKMHDLIAGAKLLVTEGATMASEAFVLGVPYLYLNPLRCGNIDFQCVNYPDRAFQTTDAQEVAKIVDSLADFKGECLANRGEWEEKTINPTEYLIQTILKTVKC